MQTSGEMSQIEHIRYRASMYLGRLGNGDSSADGIYLMLQELLHLIVNEFRDGYGKRIEVRMEDKQTVAIRDYGRGISFEERHADRSHSPKMIEDLTGFGIDTVNALSSCMDICVYRKGSASWFHYEEGMLLGEWTEKTKRKDGISITFTPDDSIFGPFQFKEDIVFAMLRDISYLNVGLEIVYDRICMKSTDGMTELLADKMRYKGEYLYPVIHFKNEVLEIALTHSQTEFGRCNSFVNGLFTKKEGTHVNAFKRAIADILLELYPSDDFIPDDVFSGMICAVSLYMEIPEISWINRWSLWSKFMTENESCTIDEYMRDFLNERLKAHLLEHPEVSDMIFGRISIAKKDRKFAQKCLSMSIDELVKLWNDGIDNKTLGTKELYAIRDAFLAKKVQTVEMQRANAIGKRLKIGYDKVFNIIHCSGRFFSETDGVLLPF